MSSPWVEEIKTDKIWICESVGKLKGIGKQGEVKTNEINIHTIADLQRYVWSYGLPNLPIRGSGWIYEHGMEALPRNRRLPSKTTEKRKYVFINLWKYMGREVKVVLLHVEILLHHWSDPVYDEVSIETDEWSCAWGLFIYCPRWFSVDDRKIDDHMDEREKRLPSLSAAHEWI